MQANHLTCITYPFTINPQIASFQGLIVPVRISPNQAGSLACFQQSKQLFPCHAIPEQYLHGIFLAHSRLCFPTLMQAVGCHQHGFLGRVINLCHAPFILYARLYMQGSQLLHLYRRYIVPVEGQDGEFLFSTFWNSNWQGAAVVNSGSLEAFNDGHDSILL